LSLPFCKNKTYLLIIKLIDFHLSSIYLFIYLFIIYLLLLINVGKRLFIKKILFFFCFESSFISAVFLLVNLLQTILFHILFHILNTNLIKKFFL